MTLEEKLKQAQKEAQDAQQAIQFHNQASQEAMQRLIRADERSRVFTELLKEVSNDTGKPAQ
jgi:hypothetical protein